MNGFHRRFYGAVTLGERGQIVIPQGARDEMGLKPGEKLLVFRQGPRGAGLSIMRAEDVSRFVADAMKALSRLSEAVSGEGGQQDALLSDDEQAGGGSRTGQADGAREPERTRARTRAD